MVTRSSSTSSIIEKEDCDYEIVDDDNILIGVDVEDKKKGGGPLSLFGRALLDFWNGVATEPLIYLRCCDQFAVQYDMYFYFTREFPPLERRALAESVGSVLDVGAGTGRHAAELLGLGGVHARQRRNGAVSSVTCVELLPEACYIMEERGLPDVYMVDVLDASTESERPPLEFRGRLLKRWFPGGQFFDTILVLGDSVGMVGTLDRVEKLLTQLRRWVREPDGKLLLDCSDILKELDRAPDEHTAHLAETQTSGRYVGESLMQYRYRGAESSPFWWCYIDWQTLETVARNAGWSTCQRLQQDGIEYLAQLTP